MRINLFNVVTSDDSLDPEPEPLRGLLHGVSGEEPHYLPCLRDQVSGFVGGLALTLDLQTPPAK
jgi:hypothetical protein